MESKAISPAPSCLGCFRLRSVDVEGEIFAFALLLSLFSLCLKLSFRVIRIWGLSRALLC